MRFSDFLEFVDHPSPHISPGPRPPQGPFQSSYPSSLPLMTFPGVSWSRRAAGLSPLHPASTPHSASTRLEAPPPPPEPRLGVMSVFPKHPGIFQLAAAFESTSAPSLLESWGYFLCPFLHSRYELNKDLIGRVCYVGHASWPFSALVGSFLALTVP